MSDWLLDTNVISAIMRQESIVAARLARLPDSDTLMISVTSHAEVRYGLLRTPAGRRKQALEREYGQLLLFTAEILVVTEAIGETYARLRFALEQRGLPRADNDLWIAATALHHNLTLVTDDDHFTLVPDLRVVNWLREPSG